jgi:hypothetical protein
MAWRVCVYSQAVYERDVFLYTWKCESKAVCVYCTILRGGREEEMRRNECIDDGLFCNIPQYDNASKIPDYAPPGVHNVVNRSERVVFHVKRSLFNTRVPRSPALQRIKGANTFPKQPLESLVSLPRRRFRPCEAIWPAQILELSRRSVSQPHYRDGCHNLVAMHWRCMYPAHAACWGLWVN